MTCTCPVAGYCETYQRTMGERAHQICRGQVLTPEKCEAYCENWRKLAAGEIAIPPTIQAATTAAPTFGLTAKEAAELFPNEDPTLLGNRIKALTEAIGIPACGGCDARAAWLNKAHQWLRSRLAPAPPGGQ